MPCINVTRITIESHPITIANGKGPTVGQMVDDYLASEARECHQVQTVAVEFEQAEWHTFREQVMADTRPITPASGKLKMPHSTTHHD